MFTLLAPLWLAAAVAVAVPLALHLLSRGSARRVRVGSVRLLAPGPTRRARRLRLRRPWLLLLRAATLALLALALAAPRAAGPAVSARPWVLVGPELVRDRDRLEPHNRDLYRRLDELKASGAQVRQLSPALPPATAASTATSRPWSALAEADTAAPAGAALHLFTPLRAALFDGERPVLERETRWWGAHDPAGNRWIESAAAGRGGPAVVVGESSAGRTVFRRLVPGEPGPDAGLGPRIVAEGSQLRLEDGGVVAGDDRVAAPGPRPLAVELAYEPERASDARFLRAALEAVEATTGWAIDLTERTLTDRVAVAEPKADPASLRFRLAAAPLPEARLDELRRKGGVLVTDAGSRYASAAAAVGLPGRIGDAPVRFSRLGDGDPGRGGVPVWQAATGEAVLVGERFGGGLWLRLRSRFDPAWSELVDRPELVLWVAELARRAAPGGAMVSARLAASDRRELAPQAVAARRLGPAPAPPPVRAWPEMVLWVAVALLVPVERLVALGERR